MFIVFSSSFMLNVYGKVETKLRNFDDVEVYKSTEVGRGQTRKTDDIIYGCPLWESF